MSGETEDAVSGWTTDTLKANVDQQFQALYRLLDERKETSDEAGRVALVAQKTAMQAALESAEKAVNVALITAERAVNKAEVAAEKRFESVNEFRSQLADQVTTFIPRAEADVRIGAVASALADHVAAADAQFKEIRAGLDTMRGNIAGTQRAVTVGIAVLALLVTIAGVLIALKP